MANQDLSEYFLLEMITTQSNIICSTSTLNFNKVYINQKLSLPLTLTNTSILPQRISFIKLKKEISIEPNDGFTLLLPNEKFTFTISFCPTSELNYNFDLLLLSNFNDQINIKINAIGIECLLLLNKSILNFRTASPGEKIIENIIIQNKSVDQHLFCEIMVPDSRLSYLKISPSILELLPSQKCRVEIEFLPSFDILEIDPKVWFDKLKNILLLEENKENNDSYEIGNNNINNNINNNNSNKTAIGNGINAAIVLGNNGNEKEKIEQNNIDTTFGVFTDFEDDSGFITVKNSFGEVQWVRSEEIILKKNIVSNSNMIKNDFNENKIEDDNDDKIKIDEEINTSIEDKILIEKTIELNKIKENEIIELNSNIPRNEWGVSGSWTLPICIKSRNSKKVKNQKNDINNYIENKKIMKIKTEKQNNNKNENDKDDKIENIENDNNDIILLPLFLNLKTMVSLPQIDCDMRIINFGQITVGSRTLKTIIIGNLFYNSINLLSNGLNACGPFSILNPVKILNNNEYKKIIIECLPLYSGLYNEILEFYNSDNLGGHRLRINLEVLCVIPNVKISGLLSQGGKLQNNQNNGNNQNNQNNGNNDNDGYLDFGDVLVNDIHIQYFTVSNDSTFPIDVNIDRTVCTGLSPYEQLNEVTDRTINGLPLFSYRPESMRLKPGKYVPSSLSSDTYYIFILSFLTEFLFIDFIYLKIDLNFHHFTLILILVIFVLEIFIFNFIFNLFPFFFSFFSLQY